MDPAPSTNTRTFRSPPLLRETVLKSCSEDGFSYRISKTVVSTDSTKFYLCCSQRSSLICHATKICVLDHLEHMQIKDGSYPHSHEPPRTQRLPEKIKESIQTQAKNHLKPAQISLNLANQFPGEFVGSKRQIRYLTNESLGLPSGIDSQRKVKLI